VVVVGYLMHWLIPAMPLAVAFTLGAIVSPTDAVATVATTQLLPLPARIVHIVNAESLLNDASGLVAFKLAVAAAATGLFSSTTVAGNFVHLAGGGIIVGIAVEWFGRELRQRLIRLHAGDPVLQTLLTVLIPYGAYLAAEALQVSGILAVVAAGLWASGQEVKGLTADARQHAREVWRMLSYVLNGVVFVLLGLQLRRMLTGVDHFAPLELAALCPGLVAAVDGAAYRLGVDLGASALPPALGLGRRAPRDRTPDACCWSAGRRCAARSPWPPRYRSRP
jgi:NhaP-type Na+/H+ or K+/H+ antiporter